MRTQLSDFGRYVSESLPKYVQKVQMIPGDKLEILIAHEGVLPVTIFLKDHHNARFTNISNIAGVDVPACQWRFENTTSQFSVTKVVNLGDFYLNPTEVIPKLPFSWTSKPAVMKYPWWMEELALILICFTALWIPN
ncbi:NADH dehydrogenase [ubiquinone] iron-sulfur protein 3, mitochondrial-like isoform X2 [Tachypleus tridentatus]|uniref:NADH dehydrogenase [ubiquinone] iron-sulfur protein 3, mitochondrial-like isoform X2 n=2 Tax=Tachypleus tridentatus TaxID=6853 RepID=UPI003FD6ADB6